MAVGTLIDVTELKALAVAVDARCDDGRWFECVFRMQGLQIDARLTNRVAASKHTIIPWSQLADTLKAAPLKSILDAMSAQLDLVQRQTRDVVEGARPF